MQKQPSNADGKGIKREIMRGVSKFALFAVAVSSLLSSPAAGADIVTFTFSDPSQYASVGSIVPFLATVGAPDTNADTIYLLGDSFDLGSPLTLDDSPYLNNFPLTLSPGQSYSDVLFNVTVPAGAPSQDYPGSFTVQASTDGINENIDVTEPFDVEVTPEPSPGLLFGAVLVGLALAVRRGKRIAV